jgi:phosphohistidine phosphatase SixA
VRYLVRHADAGDKRAWTGPDDDRPLSSTGHREAEGLAALLASFPVSEIVSSPAVRCWQTVQPLAEQRRLAVRTDGALAADAEVVRELGAPIGDDVGWPKGSVWLLESADGAITRATYLPPPSVGDRLDDLD